MNTQKAEKSINAHPEGSVYVHSIFATIQGEGIYAGHPATFIRLAGCNLTCPSCDTDYTSVSELKTPKQILEEVRGISSPNRLIVITGGEPFRQDLHSLIDELAENLFQIQIETNGTLAPTYDTSKHRYNVNIVCSPKTGKLNEKLIPHIDAYKYVLSWNSVSAKDGLPNSVLGLKVKPARPPSGSSVPVFVQPMDSKDESVNNSNLSLSKFSAMNYGHTLCLQIHKIINVE